MIPVKLDGTQYEVKTVGAKDVKKGGFCYELTKHLRKEQMRMASQLKAGDEDAMGYALVNVDGDLEPIEGIASRLLIDYRQEIIKHFTNIPEEIVDDLPLNLLEKLAIYIETGSMEPAPTGGNAATGDSNSKNSAYTPPPGRQEPKPIIFDQQKTTSVR
jgi:hypothetical protein